jgi:hypothetical protein
MKDKEILRNAIRKIENGQYIDKQKLLSYLTRLNPTCSSDASQMIEELIQKVAMDFFMVNSFCDCNTPRLEGRPHDYICFKCNTRVLPDRLCCGDFLNVHLIFRPWCLKCGRWRESIPKGDEKNNG